MSILDAKSSQDFWHAFDDPMIYRVVAFMEAVETWTKDGDPELEASVEKLGSALETAEKFKLGEEKDFIKLSTYLKMPRLLRLLQAIDTIEPGSASKVLMYAEENNSKDRTVSLFLRRNIVFERLRLLSRVFSPSRFSLVLRALENE